MSLAASINELPLQLSVDAERTLQAARDSAPPELGYAGALTPLEAWQLFSNGEALLIDVRTLEERKFVGHIPNTLHVAWATGTSLTRNPRFVRELETKFNKIQVVLFLCRSGKRSAEAARAATKSGFVNAFNVLGGFEGDLDADQRRGGTNGWRFHQLPWVQD